MRVREAVSTRRSGPGKNNLRIGKRKPPGRPCCERAVWWFVWVFGGGIGELQGLALPGHAFGAGLEDVALEALVGGLCGGTDGVAEGFAGAGNNAVAFGVVNVVVSALAFGNGHGDHSFLDFVRKL